MKKEYLSNEVLESRIVHIAHISDKNIDVSSEKRQKLFELYGSELKYLLDEWFSRGEDETSMIAWASGIYKELKGEQIDESISPRRKQYGDIMSLIRDRRSVRRWSDEPVGKEQIETLLESARWAPSSGNRQAVRLVVLEKKEHINIAVCMKEKFLARAALIFLVGVDQRVYKASEESTLAYLDAAAVIENMLLAGHSIGLGGIWSKFDKEDWEKNPESYYHIKKNFNLPGSFLPVSIVGFGQPLKESRVPPRFDYGNFVTYEDQGFDADDYPEWRPEVLKAIKKKINKKKANLISRFKKLFKKSAGVSK